MDTSGPYHVVELPAARRVVLNFIGMWVEHCMYGLLEVDVTTARQQMEEYKARTGERLSFTGYLIYCLAQAVEEDRSVQAYLKGRSQIVLFDDVDVGMMIERQVGETRAPTGYVIRRANHKTFLEIHREIRAAQATPDAPRAMPLWMRLMLALPGPLLKLFGGVVRVARRRDPAGMWVNMVGTVGITSIGMFGNISGWGLAPTGHSLTLVVGGITRKPAVVQGRIEPREILNLTLAFDHEVIDGAPAARFTRRLVEMIERGCGLDEILPSPAAVAEPASEPAPALA